MAHATPKPVENRTPPKSPEVNNVSTVEHESNLEATSAPIGTEPSTPPVEAALPESKPQAVQAESDSQTATPVPLTFLHATANRYAEKPEKYARTNANTELVGEPHEVIAPAMFLQAMAPKSNSRIEVTPGDGESEPVDTQNQVDEETLLALSVTPAAAPIEDEVESTFDDETFESAPEQLPEGDNVEVNSVAQSVSTIERATTANSAAGAVDSADEPAEDEVNDEPSGQPVLKQSSTASEQETETNLAETRSEDLVESPVVSRQESAQQGAQPLKSVQETTSPELTEPEADSEPVNESGEAVEQRTFGPQTTIFGSSAQSTVPQPNQPVTPSSESPSTPVTSVTPTAVDAVTTEARDQVKVQDATAGPRDSAANAVSVENRTSVSASTKTESPRPVLETTRSDVPQKLAGFLQQAAEQGKPMRIRLNPPELGTLQIEIGRHQGQLTARLEVETAAARSVIFEQLSVLRESLQQQGLKLDQIHVEVNESLSQGSDSGVDGDSGNGQFSEDEDRPRDFGYTSGEPAEEETTSRPSIVRTTAGVTEIDVEV
ncbi:flagellar hook-length control protein FliK [Rubinisphaera margarita]|uniref:flagellar hook-length control protein FliK n=1 Tax=Rubinisphaera margarita TaxID=2909586 RepID=UPI001EE98E73|nr:flagellar hook-length control protein FliK [Rubinisphaera margarita]MCG6154510.1 flagellar hook-length control protein FliK [Rubinisphaera margarita]